MIEKAKQAPKGIGKTTHEFVTAMGMVERNGINILEKKTILDSFNSVTLDMVRENKKRFKAKNQPELAESCEVALTIFNKLRSEVIHEGLMSIRNDLE
jgi:hypothetical protein